MSDELRQFFGVTVSGSLYEVTCGSLDVNLDASVGGTFGAFLEKMQGKIAQPTQWPALRKQHAQALGIATKLILFDPHNGGEIEHDVARIHFSQRRSFTSLIAALFLSLEEAQRCLKSRRRLSFCDTRWQEETKEVIEQIGKRHPWFHVSRWLPEFSLRSYLGPDVSADASILTKVKVTPASS